MEKKTIFCSLLPTQKNMIIFIIYVLEASFWNLVDRHWRRSVDVYISIAAVVCGSKISNKNEKLILSNNVILKPLAAELCTGFLPQHTGDDHCSIF